MPLTCIKFITYSQNTFEMRIIICFIVAVSFILFGCSKSEDGVVYTLLDPSVSVTAVEAIVGHPSGCGGVPFPKDSIAILPIDLNNDGEYDFNLICESWYNAVSNSSPCVNYNTRIVLEGINEGNMVASTGIRPYVQTYEENQVIDNLQPWRSSAFLLVRGASNPFGTDFNGLAYLALKLRQGNRDCYGWLSIEKNQYEITVFSHALNFSQDTPILAGQIE